MTLLLADDDPLTLEALTACVEPEGFTALPARNGTEALALWERHRPDIICLDVMMPGLDGYDVCRRIRAKDETVPILFLTARTEEIDAVLGFRLGADDFVRKPFGKAELLARLHAALRRSRRAAPDRRDDTFPFGPLTIYPRELRAERPGPIPDSIDLSPREISILRLLHENTGRVVHRDLLLDRCWGLNYFPESRTLDQHIAKLRKKIEPDPESPELIETIRGSGYRHRA